MPANVVQVTGLLLDRGADGLDGALGLVMTSESARRQGHQAALIQTLLAAGAKATPKTIESALAHRELEAVRALDHAVTPSIAAAFGDADALRRRLATATSAELQAVLAQAVINDRLEATRVALDAGADPNGYLFLHSHSGALHQAALHDDVDLLELLVRAGARTDLRDTLWNGTPHGWAVHEGKPRAAAYLEQFGNAAARV